MLAQGNVSNPAANQFFMTVNEALSAVNLMTQMTDQGFAFYNQLNDWLTKSK